MKIYSHIDKNVRNQIYRLLADDVPVAKIAKIVKRHRSSIYRELRRNKTDGLYFPDTAHMKAQKRKIRDTCKIANSEELKRMIRDYLPQKWSPEALAGRLKVEGWDQSISHESIYKWIYGKGKDYNLQQYLLRRKRKRGSRPCRKVKVSRIPARVSIDQRPSIDNQFGHWEGDTVHFSGNKGAIVTLYEKESKLTLGAKLNSRSTEETIGCIECLLSQVPRKGKKTLTFDNGSEFTDHQRLVKSHQLKTYFCDAYASWQKGGVENANGILRRFVPKGSKAQDYTQEQIQIYLHRINGIPRKSLGYKTPYETFQEKLNNPIILTLINLE
jgi:IS30 family transposase